MTGRKRAVVCRVLGIGRALVNRTFETSYTRKRIRRVMEIAGWTLPRNARRRTGRAHRGQIQRAVSNERWCSEGLEIACWNGEDIQIAFALANLWRTGSGSSGFR